MNEWQSCSILCTAPTPNNIFTIILTIDVNPPVTPAPPKLNSLSIKPTFSQEAHEYADIFMQYV